MPFQPLKSPLLILTLNKRGVEVHPILLIKLMKKLFTTLSMLTASAFLSGVCHAQDDKLLTVFSYRHYESDTELYKKFTEQTGIKVEVVKSKADALFERLKSEGAKSKADLVITADAGRLIKAKAEGLLQAGGSETLHKQVPTNLRDSEDNWFGITVRSRIIAYSKDRVKADEIKSYADLAQPEWKGRVVARSSSNIYNQSLLAAMIANEGPKAATKWAIGVRKNMARNPQGNDRDQIRAVASGIADATIVNTYYVGLLANSEDQKDRDVAAKIGICFPDQDGKGAHINISGAGICKHAPNKDGAIKLLEFLTSKTSQETFPKATSEFPLSMESSVPLLQSWGKFKADSLNLEKLGEHNAEAAKAFAAAGWE